MCRPTPKVEWSRPDGKPWSSRLSETPEGHGTELEITNVEAEDEGTYRCTATNGGSVASADIRLIVQCKFATLEVYYT